MTGARLPRAIERWERAYAAYRKAGDQMGAIRVARTLAGSYFAIVDDRAVSGGWLAWAQRLLGDAAEAGWVALDLGMFETDRAQGAALPPGARGGPPVR